MPDCAIATRVTIGRAICPGDAPDGVIADRIMPERAICPGNWTGGVVPVCIIARVVVPGGIIPGLVTAIASIFGGGWAGNGAIAPANRPIWPGPGGAGGFRLALRCSSGQIDVTFAAYGLPSHGLPEW